jgi:predicted nucleic-acid-binding Zn-ribbon protein
MLFRHPHARLVRRTALALGVTAALAAAAVAAGPAFATNEYFECPSCGNKNAPNNYIRNVQGINHSGTGNCTTMWWKMPNGQFQNEGTVCTPWGGTSTVCNAPSYPEFYGHSQIQSYSEVAAFLRGRQDNFTYCG